MERTYYTREGVIERAKDKEDGSYRATIYVNERARQGPDLILGGLNTENYLRNPVVLWAHDMVGKSASGGLPIGRTKKMSALDGKIEVDFEFLPGDPFADRVRNAWDKGFLQAASVSWIPVESEQGEDGNQRDIRSDLLEWSIVSVPSDPDAVRKAHARLMERVMMCRDIEEEFGDVAEQTPDVPVETPERALAPCWESDRSCTIKSAIEGAKAREETSKPEALEAPEVEDKRLYDFYRLTTELKSHLRSKK
jgi:hypothetical protein